mmetsp:Transcript_2273/g.4588  ORF Transcript_2273/g.4588 Transcript_2273/m.4588 type:complete len:219 (-) Transcript_2273:142-798(-)
MMGKSQPGGFQVGFFRLAYQLGSPWTLLGLRAWLVAAESPPPTIAPTKLEPKTTSMEASNIGSGSWKISMALLLLLLPSAYAYAYLTLPRRIPRRAAASARALKAILKKRAGFESLQAPPRGTRMPLSLPLSLMLPLPLPLVIRWWLRTTKAGVVVAVFRLRASLVRAGVETRNGPPACCSARTPFAPIRAARQRNVVVWIETFISNGRLLVVRYVGS